MHLVHCIFKRAVVVGVGAAVVALALFLVYRTPARPWEASGRLVVLTRSMPDTNATSALSFSIDDVALVSPEERRGLTLRSRRVMVNPHDDALHILLDTDAPSGSYSGLDLKATSPGLTSLTDETVPPTTLQSERLTLPLSFVVPENDTTVIILGFETQYTLRATTSGLVYLPTLHVEVRTGASVEVRTDDSALVEGGTIVTSLLFGMDALGSMRLNYREPNVPSATPETQPVLEEVRTPEATSTPQDAATTTPDTPLPEDEAASESAATTSSSS